ncbi:MAG: hypothetical protein AAF500_03870 [Myxococcota bacterium]
MRHHRAKRDSIVVDDRSHRARLACLSLVALVWASAWLPASHGSAQDEVIVERDATSIAYVPAPPQKPPKRKKIKQKNAEKPMYRRPWWSQDRRGRWKSIGLGTAGLVVGFLAHEMGHILMNFAYGNVPNFEGVRYAGFVPFFRVSSGVSCRDNGCFNSDGTPFKGGRTGAYLITAGGFNVQHVINEVLLSLDPNLQHHRSAFQKGILFFNLSLSVGYVLSTWFQVKPRIGDIEGMANASQVNRNWVALMVLIPTGLDIYRFFLPDSKWAPWVSRGSKAVFLGVSFIW